MIRTGAVVLLALLLGVAVVRNAIVAKFAVSKPLVAATVWGGHPAVEREVMMVTIGQATRRGTNAADAVRGQRDLVVIRQPLAPEPFLVGGVAAQSAGRRELAERLFSAAHRRDVRSVPAHVLLADLYLNQGKVGPALHEIAHLSRLSPGGTGALPIYLAQFAADPRNREPVRSLLAANPDLAPPILDLLAASPANSAVLLDLAGARPWTPKAKWLGIHVSALAEAGEYGRAREFWRTVAKPSQPTETLVYDANFADSVAPAPFNWSLTASGIGVAERLGAGGLQVVFYGNDNGQFARQLLVLKPGSYRLAMNVAGTLPDPMALSWSIRCAKGTAPLARLRLRSPGPQQVQFTVPANCPAQWLQLDASTQDMAARSEITITGVQLRQVAARD